MRIARYAVYLALMLMASTLPVVAVAHAVLMDSAPRAREQLDSSPKEVSVTFNESVGPVFFRVLDQNGREAGAPGEIRLEGSKMVMPLGEPLPNGTYVMTYRVISADTHPVGATIVFSVGEPIADAAAVAAAQAQAKSAWTWVVAANRWLLYAAMLIAAGSALFLTLLRVPSSVVAATVALARAAALVAAIAYVVAIGVGGAEMQLAGAGALFDGAAWSRGLASTLLPSAALGVPAMLLLWWALGRSREQPASGSLTAGAALAIASFLVTGHAATAAPVWLMATVVGVHLLATAFWIGALYPLQRATTALATIEAGTLMTRFSRFGVLAVALTLLSGIVISWVQLGEPANIIGNDYGASLIRKLVIVAVVIGIALYNKFRLTPALKRGEPGSQARIRRSIRIEYALYVLVVGAAMSLTLPTPPRATAAQSGATGAMGGLAAASERFEATLRSTEGYSIKIDLSPARAGANMLMATVRDPSGTVLGELAALEVVIGLEAAGISDVRIKGQNVGNGMWHATIEEMLIPGEWTMSVEAYVTDFDKITFTTPVTIR